MPTKTNISGKSAASNTSTILGSEANNSANNSGESDNDSSLIEPAQAAKTTGLIGFGPSSWLPDNDVNSMPGYSSVPSIQRQDTDSSEYSESNDANNEMAKFDRVDPTKYIARLKDSKSFQIFELLSYFIQFLKLNRIYILVI